jgi:polysaccharide pyruvyl transferase WcaK-like protein
MNAMVQSSRRIGLLGQLGHGNLGDDATLAVVMNNIKSRWPQAVIIGFSLNPFDTRTRHGIPSYAIRRGSKLPPEAQKSAPSETGAKMRVKRLVSKYRLLFALLRGINTVAIRMPTAFFQELFFLVESFRIIKSLDVLIICGGGQLLDSWGGPWKFPYTLFKWVLLGKLSRIKCYFINVGAGPLNHPLSKWFVKRSLLLADYVSFRDDNSKALVRRIGFTGRSHVVADSVYSLDIPASDTNHGARGEELIVGVAPMGYCDPRVYWQKDQNVYEGYIQKLASFGSWLGRHQYRLALFSTDIWFDSQAIEDLKAALAGGAESVEPRLITHTPILGIDGLLSQMYSMNYVVTCRFHGVVFAHLLNKPVLALSHHPKVSTLMDDLGLAQYCVDIRTCDVNVLTETFTSLVSNSDEIKSRMAKQLACYKRDLAMQFEDVFRQVAAL